MPTVLSYGMLTICCSRGFWVDSSFFSEPGSIYVLELWPTIEPTCVIISLLLSSLWITSTLGLSYIFLMFCCCHWNWKWPVSCYALIMSVSQVMLLELLRNCFPSPFCLSPNCRCDWFLWCFQDGRLVNLAGRLEYFIRVEHFPLIWWIECFLLIDFKGLSPYHLAPQNSYLSCFHSKKNSTAAEDSPDNEACP